MESIGGGQAEEGWGQVGSRRQVNAPIRTQRVVLCLQYVTLTDTICKGGPDCHKEQFGTSSSPINANQDHEMHPHGLQYW